jgi:hypothetical protein
MIRRADQSVLYRKLRDRFKRYGEMIGPSEAHKYEVQGSTSMSQVVKHKIMTKLVDDLELKVLKSSSGANVHVNGEDLLILIEYTRQLEAVINMMDGDPSQAKQLYKH